MYILFIYSILRGLEWFSYLGLRSILLLYLIHIIDLDDNRAQEIYGGYIIACYILCLIGGYISDQFIGAKHSLILGSVMLFIGHITFFFSYENEYNIVLALTAMSLGNGIFKPNAKVIIGAICDSSNQKEFYYRFYYLVFNQFGFFAPIITTYFYMYQYEYGFLAAAFAMIFVFILLFDE